MAAMRMSCKSAVELLAAAGFARSATVPPLAMALMGWGSSSASKLLAGGG